MLGITTESKCNGKGSVWSDVRPMCVSGDGLFVAVRVESGEVSLSVEFVCLMKCEGNVAESRIYVPSTSFRSLGI